MIELLLSFLSDDLSSVIFPALAFLSGVLLIIFMALHSKSEGEKVSAPYYICAFLLPLVTAIIYFFSCRKRVKETNEGKKKNTLSLVFGALFCLSYLATAVFGLYMANDIANYKAFEKEMETTQQGEVIPERIRVENENGQFVYYDARGNEYTQSLMVKIYNEKGIPFDYARFQDFDKEGNEFYKGYYLDGSGRKLDSEYCFVDENGIFVYKKDVKCEEENKGDKKYFECPYTDSEGSKYYPATLASWDKNGKLILE